MTSFAGMKTHSWISDNSKCKQTNYLSTLIIFPLFLNFTHFRFFLVFGTTINPNSKYKNFWKKISLRKWFQTNNHISRERSGRSPKSNTLFLQQSIRCSESGYATMVGSSNNLSSLKTAYLILIMNYWKLQLKLNSFTKNN